MRLLISFVIAWFLGTAIVTGAELPEEYILDSAQRSALFADDSRQELLSALKEIPWQEGEQISQDSLLFTSGQSLGPQGERVINRIQFFSKPRFDIWIMKQALSGRGYDFRNWNRVAIAVDKKAHPKQAYYFQLGRESPNETKLPPFKAFTAACLTCHSSGPLVIRPESTHWTKPLTARQKTVLNTWNERITNYREVADFSPTWKGRPMIESMLPGSREALGLHACVECHSTGSGVRSLLRRQNADSILYLTHESHAEMPMERKALDNSERHCLKLWLQNDLEGLKKTHCTPEGEVGAAKEHEWILDPFFSRLSAIAETSVSPIFVNHLLLSGQVHCQQKGDTPTQCSGRLWVDLHAPQTGIDLRDQHLLKLLSLHGAPLAQINLKNVQIRSEHLPITTEISLGGKTKNVKGDIQCSPTTLGHGCEINFSISLSDFELTAPHFLGLGVNDEIQIKGRLSFRQESAFRRPFSQP